MRETPPEDPYATSIRLKKIVQPKHSGHLSAAEVAKAIKLVFDTPRNAMSVPVWNMLLSAIGKVGRLELMWKTFNDVSTSFVLATLCQRSQMKKRGYKPNSRTFTTLLNAYAGVRHSFDLGETRSAPSIEARSKSRVSIIYDQAQAYLSAKMEEVEAATRWNDPDELGLATDAEPDEVKIDSTLMHDVNVGPTNAYLKFLASARMYNEMDKVFVAMPTIGPLSPDTITYTTMFSALYDSLNARARLTSDRPQYSTTPNGIWARMCRQFLSESADKTDTSRSPDQTVVLVALKCLARSDQRSQRLVMDLIDTIWNVPRPNASEPPMLRGPSGYTIPQLPLTLRAATTIMSVCPKPTDRSHYAHVFLNRSDLQKQLDTPFLIAAIRALSETGDIRDVCEILDNYQPRQPNHWPISVWHDSLTAARWSKSEEQGMRTQPDFDAALAVFRRMTHLPPGVEGGHREGDYRILPPNGEPKDIRGIMWAKTPPIAPDAKALSLLIKTSLGRGWREVEQAIRVYDYYQTAEGGPCGERSEADSDIRGRQWDQELAKDVQRACERLLERQLPPDQVRAHRRRLEAVKHDLSCED